MIWGSVPEWVGAVGTAAAFLWAVFLYRQSIRDKEIAQARLLSIVKPPVPIQILPDRVTGEAPKIFLAGNPQLRAKSGGTGVELVTTEESVLVDLHLVSTSDETFFIESVDILRRDGTVVPVPNSWPDIAPHAEFKVGVHFPTDYLGATESFRIRFQDASGRTWERINRQPVRKFRPKGRLRVTLSVCAKKFSFRVSAVRDQIAEQH